LPKVSLEKVWPTLTFLCIVFFFQFIVVKIAQSLGATDPMPLKFNGLEISLLFHILPITVVIALVACWIHLTNYLTIASYRERKKEYVKQKKERKKPEFFLKLKSFFENVRVKSILVTSLCFFSLAILIFTVSMPNLIGDSIVGAFNANPSFLGFIAGIRNAFCGAAQSLGPIGGLMASIDGTLKSASVGFRNFVNGLSTVIQPIINLDITGKYLLCQNLAVFIPSLATLVYSKLILKPRKIRIRRKKR